MEIIFWVNCQEHVQVLLHPKMKRNKTLDFAKKKKKFKLRHAHGANLADPSVNCFNKLITKLAGMIRRLMRGWKPAVRNTPSQYQSNHETTEKNHNHMKATIIQILVP